MLRSFIFLHSIIFCLCSVVLMSMISVFSMLNFATQVSHHLFRVLDVIKPVFLAQVYSRFVSSANSFIVRHSVCPRIWMPVILGSFLILHASGSIARSKRGHERGSPCLTPLVTWYGSLITLLTPTTVWALLYRDFTVSVKGFGRPKAVMVFHK